MKAVSFYILVSLGIGTPGYSGADQRDLLPPSAIVDIYRQCYIAKKNCERAKALVQESTTPGEEDYIKQELAKCPEERVDLATIKSADALIAHNYKINVCEQEILSSLTVPDQITSDWAIDEAAGWALWIDNYYSTEYQLGHITKDQFASWRNKSEQITKTLFNVTSVDDAQTQEIEQLKAQVASLQSADHERCRQIQILAALHGATPQVCP